MNDNLFCMSVADSGSGPFGSLSQRCLSRQPKSQRGAAIHRQQVHLLISLAGTKSGGDRAPAGPPPDCSLTHSTALRHRLSPKKKKKKTQESAAQLETYSGGCWVITGPG